ncbi:MAG: DUF4105 domain-containing protein [Gemmatimonadales bacterium]
MTLARAAGLQLAVLALFGASTPRPVFAQDSAPSAAPAELTVYLMTFGPGARVWERFGHNAIWIHDPVHRTDDAYNYGLFDFAQENFILRFVRGQMWYWMAGFPADRYVAQYQRDNRSVWVQELELTPAARQELQAFLQWNAEPEHRFYHYDYYRDNCSTRVRDAIDRVLGGTLRTQTENVPTSATYRFHTQRLTANDPPIYTGLLLALGERVDQPIFAWDEMFLPLKMREHVRLVTVPGPNGGRLPLVRSERTLFESTAPAPPDAPPNWLRWYLAAGLAIGVTAWLLAREARGSGLARFGFVVVGGGWMLLAGLAGVVLAGLWGLTDHVAAACNENLLQMSPLALLVLPGITGSRGRRGRLAAVAATAVAGLSALGLGLKLLPAMDQVNGPIIALALPAQIGIAAGLNRLRGRQRWEPEPPARRR